MAECGLVLISPIDTPMAGASTSACWSVLEATVNAILGRAAVAYALLSLTGGRANVSKGRLGSVVSSAAFGVEQPLKWLLI